MLEEEARTYLIFAEAISKDGDKIYSKQLGLTYKAEDKKQLVSYFEGTFKRQFLGLDYQYFQKTKDELLTSK